MNNDKSEQWTSSFLSFVYVSKELKKMTTYKQKRSILFNNFNVFFYKKGKKSPFWSLSVTRHITFSVFTC